MMKNKERTDTLRSEIIDMVKLFGVAETESALHIVILGIRKNGIENIKG